MKRNAHYWLTPGEEGVTPLHDAARNGHLDRVPKEFLLSKALLKADKKGNTPLHFAARYGHLNQIPNEIMLGVASGATHAGIAKRTFGAFVVHVDDEFTNPTLADLAKSVAAAIPNIVGNLFIGTNMLLPNNIGNTPLHLAAKFGHIDQVPPELVTESNLRATNNLGESVTEVAFSEKGGYQIPPTLLTENTMLQKDADGKTAIHIAAQHGTLDAIPTTIITEETLLLADKMGTTPLHLAAAYGHLEQIPKKFLTADNLLTIDKQGLTALHMMKNIAKTSQLDLLLGLDFPESVKELVGETWWEANEAAKLSIAESKKQLEPPAESTSAELELY